MDIVSVLTGAAAVAGTWFTVLGTKKAVPAALGWFKNKWSARGDLVGVAVGELEARFASEIDHVQGLIAELSKQHQALEGAVAALEAKLALPKTAPAPVAPPLVPAAPVGA